MAKQTKSREDLEREVADLKAKLGEATLTPITGTYKGYAFDDGHRKIRNQIGEICDTQMVMDAANKGDKEAIEILDWLIDLGYAHLKLAKVDAA